LIGQRDLRKLKNKNQRHIRVIRTVRKTQHQNPEFGHTQGETQKNPAKKYLSVQGVVVKLRIPSMLMVPEFRPVFLFP